MKYVAKKTLECPTFRDIFIVDADGESKKYFVGKPLYFNKEQENKQKLFVLPKEEYRIVDVLDVTANCFYDYLTINVMANRNFKKLIYKNENCSPVDVIESDEFILVKTNKEFLEDGAEAFVVIKKGFDYAY